MLTQGQLEDYRRNGFVVVEGVLSSAELAEARQVVDGFIERARQVRASDEVYDLEPGHSAQRPLVRRLKAPHTRHPFFAELIRSAKILDLLQPLIGPAIRHLGSKLNMKAAAEGSAVEWHQDLAFHPMTNNDVCAVGVALDDADLDNGCLLFIPGSHRGPILDHHSGGYFVGAIDPRAGRFDPAAALPAIAPAGSVSIHHGRMVHGSAGNRSARQRRLLLYDMAAVDAWPIAWDPGDLETFNAEIVRGQPTLEARVEAMSVRIPRPARPAGSIFELQAQTQQKAFVG